MVIREPNMWAAYLATKSGIQDTPYFYSSSAHDSIVGGFPPTQYFSNLPIYKFRLRGCAILMKALSGATRLLLFNDCLGLYSLYILSGRTSKYWSHTVRPNAVTVSSCGWLTREKSVGLVNFALHIALTLRPSTRETDCSYADHNEQTWISPK